MCATCANGCVSLSGPTKTVSDQQRRGHPIRATPDIPGDFNAALEAELRSEAAAALKKCVEKMLAAQRDFEGMTLNDSRYNRALARCRERTWYYLVQRDAMGLSNTSATSTKCPTL